MNKEQAAKDYQYEMGSHDEWLSRSFIAGATWQEQQNANIPTQKKIHKASVESGNYKSFRKGAEWAIQQIHTHPHSTYMEFAEWYKTEDMTPIYFAIHKTTTHDLFQYWITNVKNKG